MRFAVRISAWLAIGIVILVAGPWVSAQSAAPATTAQADNRIYADLDKLTHAKRVKPGDTVTAHVIALAKLPDGREIAKGSKLVGQVTDLKAKPDAEGPSKIGLLFTSVRTKDGKDIRLRMALVAVAPHNQQNDVDLLAAGNPFSGQNRMQAGSASGTLNTTSNEGEALSRGLGARAPATQSNVGVSEMAPGKSYLPDVAIASYSVANPGTVFVSKSGSVYLDSGVRLLFLVMKE